MADIITGQYVKIMQTPASIGERMAAQLIDWVVMVAYYFLFYYIFDTLSWVSFTAVLLFLILPILFYSLLCEIFNNGQTIGKWFMKTRVVMKDGTTPSLGSYLLRWLLWIVDAPPYLSLVYSSFLSTSTTSESVISPQARWSYASTVTRVCKCHSMSSTTSAAIITPLIHRLPTCHSNR